MRIQIKVYIDAEKDQDCYGEKPDYWVSAENIPEAIEQLTDLKPHIIAKMDGVPDEPIEMP